MSALALTPTTQKFRSNEIRINQILENKTMLQNLRLKLRSLFARNATVKQNRAIGEIPLYLQRDAGLVQKDINNSYEVAVRKRRMQKPVIWL